MGWITRNQTHVGTDSD